MNFKLSFLCILLVNFLPQSFALPKNSTSRTVDELVKEIEEDQKLLHELLIMEGVLKTKEPPSKTAGEAKTTEKAPTTSQSTLTENDTITELPTPLTNNATIDNATLFSQFPTLNKTTVTTNETTAAKKNDSIKSDETTLSEKVAKQAESRDDGLINRSHFPTIFMVILVIVVVIYMIYHNRNKIHNFIKKHRSGDHESSPGYVKVKVDDDLDLPRDANRHYVY